MKILEIHGRQTTSRILVGETLRHIKNHINLSKTVIITDKNVIHYYHKYLPKCPVIEVGTGEIKKNLKTVQFVFQKLLDYGADRSCFILGIGGGVVCDIAGFVASTYLRGVEFGFISTTLLSQVDASVGGKNGVNFEGYKNMVGVFNQPHFVICDFEMLKTLPRKEILSGFGEIVKHAIIGDKNLFSYLENYYKPALNLDMNVIGKIIYDSIVVKSKIVQMDEIETGERRKLNFGHTFGHAIEKVSGFSHGKSVSMGMVIAAQLSERRGMIEEKQVEKILNLLKKLKLPTTFTGDKGKMMDAILKDKKRVGDKIKFVFIKDLGKPVIGDISFDELEEAVHDLC